ncbi:MAG: hypothetical protein ACPG8W_15055, partial [Candidatus Promineifilaceae bacterium]
VGFKIVNRFFDTLIIGRLLAKVVHTPSLTTKTDLFDPNIAPSAKQKTHETPQKVKILSKCSQNFIK